MTPCPAWQKNEEKHTGRKNNCVKRKWESHSTKEVFLCCLAAGSQIKAAVNWSNICIFVPFFQCVHLHLCVFVHAHTRRKGCVHGVYTQTFIHTPIQTHTLSTPSIFIRVSLLTLRDGGGGFCSTDGTCSLKGSKGQGPECKGHGFVPVVTSFPGGTFPPVWGY